MKKVIRTKDGFRVTNINRRRACRLMCTECLGWDDADRQIDECTGKMIDGSVCALVDFRKMTGEQDPVKRKRAIMDFCLECMGDDSFAISKCTSKFCPVHAYRNSKVDNSVLYNPELSDKLILGLNMSVKSI